MRRWIEEQRRLGRAHQLRFRLRQVGITALGALIALALMGVLSL